MAKKNFWPFKTHTLTLVQSATLTTVKQHSFAAITTVLAKKGFAQAQDYDSIDKKLQKNASVVSQSTQLTLSTETDTRLRSRWLPRTRGLR